MKRRTPLGYLVVYHYTILTVSFLTLLFDSMLPPRTSERLVRGLGLEDLFILTPPGGSALPYHDPRVTALVWEVKYRANKRALSLAGEFLAEQLLAIAGEELGKLLLVPVPMHHNRRKKSGHNQTELLCTALLPHAQEYADYAPQALVRTLDTRPQQGLERGLRLKNVYRSMEASPALVAGRVCVALDDVTTTGATLEEARRALRAGGARRVHFLTLAQS